MKLWLDDVRPAPEGWHWVTTVEGAKAAFLTYEISEASLDHDLGGDSRHLEGMALVRWMCEAGMYPTKRVTVHSWNPVGAENMANALHAAGCPCEIIALPFVGAV